MMFMVVLAGLILGAVTLFAESASRGNVTTAAGTAAMTLVPAAAGSAVMLYCSRRARRASAAGAQGDEDARRLSQFRTRASTAVNYSALATYAAALHLFGWSAMPARLGVAQWELPTRLVLAAPFLLSLVLAWIPLHYAHACTRGSGPTLRQQLSFNVRQYILTLLVPLAVIVGLMDLASAAAGAYGGAIVRQYAGGAVAGAAVLAGYALAPVLLVRLWKTTTLPPSPLRERLSELCRKASVKFRDIRIWETPGLMFLNAAVLGMTAQLRYVVVSRVLLESLPRPCVEAVFAHELAHAKKHHLAYYLVFALDFTLLMTVFERLSGAQELWPDIPYQCVTATAFLLYWGIGFGWLSRLFEREADMWGAEACGDAGLFASALAAITEMNGITPAARSWRHGSVRSRLEFVMRAAGDAKVREAFAAKAGFVRMLLIATAVVSVAAVLALECIPW